MSGWNHLPREIRDMIFDLVRLLIASSPSTATSPLFPSLPLVCREWQTYFSHENFRLLVLDQDRLDDFKRHLCANAERQAYVQVIILRIKLPEYNCKVCQKPEDRTTARNNDQTFLNTIGRLMDMLSTWNVPTNAVKDDGVVLDIGAYSPSDGQHAFRDCRFSSSYPYGADQKVYSDHERALQQTNPTDQCPGWKRNLKGTYPLNGTKRRLLSTLCDGESSWLNRRWIEQGLGYKHFKPVPRVTSLFIRRHYYRQISPRILAKLIAEGLPRLLCFRHEMWERAWPYGRQSFQREYWAVLGALPSTLRHMSLVNNYLTKYTPRPLSMSSEEAGHRLGHRLAQIVVRSALTSLNVSFVVDASELFVPILHLQFVDVETLTITSKDLHPGVKRQEDVAFLKVFGWAALQSMPRLKVLEVWNQKDGDHFTAILRTSSAQSPQDVTITWSSTWHADGALDSVWRLFRRTMAVLPWHRGKRLVVTRTLLVPGVLNAWQLQDGSVMPSDALHPESERQIQYERRGIASRG